MVFQNYALFPHLTVRANVALRAEDAPRSRKAEATRRVDEALRLVQLTEHAHKHPGSSPAASSNASPSPARSSWSRPSS